MNEARTELASRAARVTPGADVQVGISEKIRTRTTALANVIYDLETIGHKLNSTNEIKTVVATNSLRCTDEVNGLLELLNAQCADLEDLVNRMHIVLGRLHPLTL